MNPVPDFPKTRPIALDDKGFFDRLLKQFPPEISEHTFTNLFAWRKAYHFEIAMAAGCLLVISAKDRGLCAYDPIGAAEDKKRAIGDFFARAPENGRARFIRLPEATKALAEKEGAYTIKEDRDNFDYVYRTTDLIELKGAAYDGKRNFIKRFKDAGDFSYGPLTADNVAACLAFQEEWCLVKDCQHTEGLAAEREAMRQMLENFDALKVAGAMIRIDGKVEAVTLGEALNPETFVIHIEKANGRFIGIYQAINNFFCASHAKGYAFVNREQDLGVAGLRKAKESYHPCRLVKKYTLALR